ncbi:MAG: hypothetical protein WBA74_04345 [Cyclobacteriaceae bacterium]
MKKIIIIVMAYAYLTGCSDPDEISPNSSKDQSDNSIESLSDNTSDRDNANRDVIILDYSDTRPPLVVNSLEEASAFLLNNFDPDLPEVQGAVRKIDQLAKELEYSKDLDLDDPEVEAKYEVDFYERLGQSPTVQTEATLGTLFDGIASGFLSTTVVPLNLKSSKRNRASSVSRVFPGAMVILCDKKWFKGDKYIAWRLLPGTIILPSSFNNRTDSFF